MLSKPILIKFPADEQKFSFDLYCLTHVPELKQFINSLKYIVWCLASEGSLAPHYLLVQRSLPKEHSKELFELSYIKVVAIHVDINAAYIFELAALLHCTIMKKTFLMMLMMRSKTDSLFLR
jgi:hypothetical protein